eukprot:g2402.t1
MDGTSIAQGKAQDQEMRRLRKLAMLRRQQEQLAALEAELALCKENVGQKPRKLSEATKGVVNKTAPLTPSRKGGNKGNAFAPSAPEQDYFTFEPPAHLPGDKNSSHNLNATAESNTQGSKGQLKSTFKIVEDDEALESARPESNDSAPDDVEQLAKVSGIQSLEEVESSAKLCSQVPSLAPARQVPEPEAEAEPEQEKEQGERSDATTDGKEDQDKYTEDSDIEQSETVSREAVTEPFDVQSWYQERVDNILQQWGEGSDGEIFEKEEMELEDDEDDEDEIGDSEQEKEEEENKEDVVFPLLPESASEGENEAENMEDESDENSTAQLIHDENDSFKGDDTQKGNLEVSNSETALHVSEPSSANIILDTPEEPNGQICSQVDSRDQLDSHYDEETDDEVQAESSPEKEDQSMNWSALTCSSPVSHEIDHSVLAVQPSSSKSSEVNISAEIVVCGSENIAASEDEDQSIEIEKSDEAQKVTDTVSEHSQNELTFSAELNDLSFSGPAMKRKQMLKSIAQSRLKRLQWMSIMISFDGFEHVGRKTMGHYTNLQEEVKKPGDVNSITRMDEFCGKALRLDISEMKVAISLNHSVKYVEHIGPDLLGNISVQLEVGIGHQNVIVTSNNLQQNVILVNHTVFDNDFLSDDAKADVMLNYQWYGEKKYPLPALADSFKIRSQSFQVERSQAHTVKLDDFQIYDQIPKDDDGIGIGALGFNSDFPPFCDYMIDFVSPRKDEGFIERDLLHIKTPFTGTNMTIAYAAEESKPAFEGFREYTAPSLWKESNRPFEINLTDPDIYFANHLPYNISVSIHNAGGYGESISIIGKPPDPVNVFQVRADSQSSLEIRVENGAESCARTLGYNLSWSAGKEQHTPLRVKYFGDHGRVSKARCPFPTDDLKCSCIFIDECDVKINATFRECTAQAKPRKCYRLHFGDLLAYRFNVSACNFIGCANMSEWCSLKGKFSKPEEQEGIEIKGLNRTYATECNLFDRNLLYGLTSGRLYTFTLEIAIESIDSMATVDIVPYLFAYITDFTISRQGSRSIYADAQIPMSFKAGERFIIGGLYHSRHVYARVTALNAFNSWIMHSTAKSMTSTLPSCCPLPSNVIENFTEPATAPGAPTIPVLAKKTGGAVHVTWRPPKDTGGVALDSYRFLISENEKVRRTEKSIEKFKSNNGYEVDSYSASAPPQEHTEGGLVPFQNFEFSVRYANEDKGCEGWGEVSGILAVRTGSMSPAGPAESPKLIKKTGGSITIRPQQPVDAGGYRDSRSKFSGVKVYMRRSATKETFQPVFIGLDDPFIFEKQEGIKITGLSSNTPLQFYTSAMTFVNYPDFAAQLSENKKFGRRENIGRCFIDGRLATDKGMLAPRRLSWSSVLLGPGEFKIDELRLWDVPLEVDFIRRYMSQSLHNPSITPTLYFSFDETMKGGTGSEWGRENDGAHEGRKALLTKGKELQLFLHRNKTLVKLSLETPFLNVTCTPSLNQMDTEKWHFLALRLAHNGFQTKVTFSVAKYSNGGADNLENIIRDVEDAYNRVEAASGGSDRITIGGAGTIGLSSEGSAFYGYMSRVAIFNFALEDDEILQVAGGDFLDLVPRLALPPSSLTASNFWTNSTRGDGAPSDILNEITLSPSNPEAPTDIVLIYASGGALTIGWKAPSDLGGCTFAWYELEILPESHSVVSTNADNAKIEKEQFTVVGLEEQTAYKVRVKVAAVTDEGVNLESEWSKYTLISTTAKTVPGAPAPPSIAAVSDVKIMLAWDDPMDKGGNSAVMKHFEVEMRNLAQVGMPFITVYASSENYAVINSSDALLIQENSKYEAKVRAVNDVGAGPFSQSINIQTRDLCDIEVGCTGAGAATLHWRNCSNSTSTAMIFELQRKQSSLYRGTGFHWTVYGLTEDNVADPYSVAMKLHNPTSDKDENRAGSEIFSSILQLPAHVIVDADGNRGDNIVCDDENEMHHSAPFELNLTRTWILMRGPMVLRMHTFNSECLDSVSVIQGRNTDLEELNGDICKRLTNISRTTRSIISVDSLRGSNDVASGGSGDPGTPFPDEDQFLYPKPVKSLHRALEIGADLDSMDILLYPGSFDDTCIVSISQKVRVRGVMVIEPSILFCKDGNGIFEVELNGFLELRNVRIIAGKAPVRAVQVMHGHLLAHNTIFSAAIYAEGSEVELYSVTFEDLGCTAMTAINTGLNVTNISFRNISASLDNVGGALRVLSGSLTGRDISCRKGCSASGGGFLYASNASAVTLANLDIQECSAGRDGGGFIRSETDAYVVVRNSSVLSSKSYCNGGSIYATTKSTVIIQDFDIQHTECDSDDFCEEKADGGFASIASFASVHLLHSNVQYTAAAREGGLAFVSGPSTFRIAEESTIGSSHANVGGVFSLEDKSMVESNLVNYIDTAASDCGFAIVEELNVQLENSSVVSSTSAKYGGAFVVSNGAMVFLSHSTIRNSITKGDGGVIILRGTKHSKLLGDQSFLINGSAGSRGGGVFLDHAGHNVSGVNIVGCKAIDGGGMHLYGGSSIVANVRVSDSSAIKTGGGAMIEHGGGVDSAEMRTSAVFDNVHFDSCSSGTKGGGLFLDDNTEVKIGETTFRHCRSGRGGGLFFGGESVTAHLNATEFFKCNSDEGGGGIFMESKATLLAQRVVIDHCGSGLLSGSDMKGAGGGLHVTSGAVLQLEKSFLRSNVADSGGGMHISSSSIGNIRSTLFESNEVDSSSYGGGIFVEDCALNFWDVTLRNNKAGFGAAVRAQGFTAQINISSSKIEGNVARYDGGGLSVSLCLVHLQGSTFKSNVASDFGGGIKLELAAKIIAKDSIFENNIAGGLLSNGAGVGSAVYLSRATESEWRSSKFAMNTALEVGTIYGADCHVMIFDCDIERNEARVGAGIIFDRESRGDIVRSRISNNTAAERASGVQLRGIAEATLRDTIIMNNIVKGSDSEGAGIHANSFTRFQVFGGLIRGNRAFEGAGIALIENAWANISGVTFKENIANTNGGGILSTGNSTLYLNSVRFISNVARRKGAGLSLDHTNCCMQDGSNCSKCVFARGIQFENNSAPAGSGVFWLIVRPSSTTGELDGPRTGVFRCLDCTDEARAKDIFAANTLATNTMEIRKSDNRSNFNIETGKSLTRQETISLRVTDFYDQKSIFDTTSKCTIQRVELLGMVNSSADKVDENIRLSIEGSDATAIGGDVVFQNLVLKGQ